MPVLFILGPIFGIAAIAILVAHAHKGAAPPRTHALQIASAQHFELDHGMPEELVHQVLAALVHGQEPVQLETLARELHAKYPIAADELHAKAATLRETLREAVSSPPVAVGTPHEAPPVAVGTPHEGTSPTPAATSPDTGEAALILQAAMRAYAHETDPVSLEGFAESIRAKYPTAAVLLLGRAHELLAAQASTAAQASAAASASPDLGLGAGASATQMTLSPLAISASAPPTKPTTYLVQAGDTPTAIADRLTHDGTRWPELALANPGRPTAPDGTFAPLQAGETLTLPASWTASLAHPPTSALPKEAHP